MTNGEWLRSLTDEKIVEILCHYNDKCNICAYGDSICVEHGDQECCKGITKWLQRECEE